MVISTWPDMATNMDEVRRLKDEVRSSLNIFDAEAKERVAETYGIRLDAFYRMPYVEWIAIRSEWSARIERAMNAATAAGHPLNQPVSAWSGFLGFMREDVSYG